MMQAHPLSKTIEKTMSSALSAHQAGRLDCAEQRYRRILEIEPRHTDALHFLGVIAYQKQDHQEAADLITEAIRLNPADPACYSNLGLVQQELGQLDEAAGSFEKALELAPAHADAWYNLGIVRREQNRLDEAVDSYRRAIERDPQHVQAHGNLGALYHLYGELEKAITCYRTALSIAPDSAEILRNLGDALQQQNRFDEATACYKQAISLAPKDARALSRLSMVVRKQGQVDEAVRLCRQATAADPQLPDAWRNLGQALKEQGDLHAACDAYRRGLFLRRRPGEKDREGLFTFMRTSRSKLRHDIEQLEYLVEKKLLDEAYATAADDYRAVLDTLDQGDSDARLLDLPPGQLRRIAPTYNRLIHYYDAPALKEEAVNPQLDTAAIEQNYRDNAPGITFFDEFLTPPALAEIRRVCLESTIWYDFRHVNGYVGAYLQDGFCCPLLIQVAEELPRALPVIFGDHKLLQLWAYKYDSDLAGIEMHADFAAVNVNFWITPSEANRKPGTGGLVVWDKEAPVDWDIDRFNSSEAEDQAAIKALLEESGATPVTVPYRQNRVVIFNSDLFHKTDEIHFHRGYENRRINITMLYGRRENAHSEAED